MKKDMGNVPHNRGCGELMLVCILVVVALCLGAVAL